MTVKLATTADVSVPLNLELGDISLESLSSLAGSALELIVRDLKDDEQTRGMARHSSHSSYTSHGTAAW